jgi:hypothetical protein
VISSIVVLALAGAAQGPATCVGAPPVNILAVVGPMVGSSPVWAVRDQGVDIGAPMKTLWVVARDVRGPLRVTGRRLDGTGALGFQDGYQRPTTDALVVESAGCWEMTAMLGAQTVRFTIDATAPRYVVTSEPINVGITQRLCIAVDLVDSHSVWWWEPGRGGCSTRSTGPNVFRAEDSTVRRNADAIEAGFRLPLTATPPGRDHFDVQVVIRNGRLKSLASGADVAVTYRSDLDVPER